MSETNKEVVRSFVSAVNSHDWDSLRVLLVPHFIRHSDAGGAPDVCSAEELITYLKNEYVTFPDAEETLVDLVAEGERVAARSHFRGTQVGPMGSYPPQPGRCFPRTTSLSIAWKAGALLKRGQNGTTCMGCDNLATTLQRRLLIEKLHFFRRRFFVNGQIASTRDQSNFATSTKSVLNLGDRISTERQGERGNGDCFPQNAERWVGCELNPATKLWRRVG